MVLEMVLEMVLDSVLRSSTVSNITVSGIPSGITSEDGSNRHLIFKKAEKPRRFLPLILRRRN
jgi:hypothetical protein